MRGLLWPDDTADEHAEEVAVFFGTKSFRWSAALPAVAVFRAVRPFWWLCGFLEASIRPVLRMAAQHSPLDTSKVGSLMLTCATGHREKIGDGGGAMGSGSRMQGNGIRRTH